MVIVLAPVAPEYFLELLLCRKPARQASLPQPIYRMKFPEGFALVTEPSALCLVLWQVRVQVFRARR